MKKQWLISLIALIVVTGFSLPEPLPIGSTLPLADKNWKDVSGKMISASAARKEKGLLVMFSCNTCPYVIKNQVRTKAICEYALKNNIGVLVFNSNEAYREEADSYEAMQAYAKAQDYRWWYAVDAGSEMANAVGAGRTPECYLFNQELKLVYHGAIDNNPSDASAVTRKHLELAIDELAAGKEISMKETKSVGCSIKRKS